MRADGVAGGVADNDKDGAGDADAEGVTGASSGTPDGITVGAELPRAAHPGTGPPAEDEPVPHAAATNTKAKAPRRRT